MLENTGTRRIYLDHNATTQVSEKIIQGLGLITRMWGNPSSIHYAGRAPKSILRETRNSLSEALGVSPLEIVFTSGGTEGNNTVIQGVCCLSLSNHEALLHRNEYITSTVEHPSVLKTFQFIETTGAKVHYLPVNRKGEIDLEMYEKVLSEKTALVSIMFANNETGVLFPIQKMAKMAHQKGALFHSDCVQALGKMTLNLKKMEIDYATFSAHKVYALKGVGALYIKKGSPFQPLIFGGAQERHRRGGTENTLGVWAFGEMAKELGNMSERYEKLTQLRDYFEDQILKELEDISITSKEAPRLPNTSSLVLKGVDGETLLMSLDLRGFAVSTGAACSSGSPEPSPVLLAIGLTRQEAQNSLRVTIGWNTTKDQLDEFIKTLKEVVHYLRSFPKEKMVIENMSSGIQNASFE